MKKLAAIGMFDGVHLGHRAMLADLKDRAREMGMEPAAVTFSTHPMNLVRPEAAPRMLMPAEDRRRALAEVCGAPDRVIMLDFTPELRQLTAREFMKMLRDTFDVGALYLGYNHRFGSDRMADFDDYRRVAASLGMDALLGAEERGPQGCRISSSDVRTALSEGDVGHAAMLLGRPYRIEGEVVGGRQIGRTLGFPTANIVPRDPRQLVPATGVYAARAELSDGSRWKAVVNIGHRPTMGDSLAETIEANLLDFSGDLYGQSITLEFVARLRDEQRFDSLDLLRDQIARDAERARNLL